MLPLLLSAFCVMLASLVGVVTVWRGVGSVVERNSGFLISFSAGVFAVFEYQLAHESLEHATSLQAGVLWILVGALVVWLAFKFLPGAHHHAHGVAGHPPLDARRLLLTDSIHNAADGIFLAASFAVSSAFGVVAAVSIFVHEALQELSEFFVLRGAGYSVRGALKTNFLVSATILVGALGGYYLLGLFAFLEAPLLGVAAGGILVVVLHDLIPHSVREAISTAHYAKHLLWFLLGLALMLAVVLLLGHE